MLILFKCVSVVSAFFFFLQEKKVIVRGLIFEGSMFCKSGLLISVNPELKSLRNLVRDSLSMRDC